MTIDAQEFRMSYAQGLQIYLRDGDDRALHAAYELGRHAVEQELTMLELAAAHHDQLLVAVRGASNGADIERVTMAAGQFFLESLSAFEMVRRGFREASDIALLERRHAAMLRQLSNFLADASLAMSASESVREVLALVAEQARDLLDAECAVASVGLGQESDQPVTVASHAHSEAPSRGEREGIAAPINALDGRELGSIEVVGKLGGEFTDIDRAILAQLAQMVSAAVERTQLYDRGR